MTPDFHHRLQHEQIVAALRAAARETTAEIRVVISRRRLPDPVASARREFARHGMHLAPQHHGVLLLVAPRSRTCAIVGDQAIHERCGDDFWRTIADAMAKYFAKNEPTLAILHGISEAGRVLARHFPRQPQNDLPAPPGSAC